ncbi:peptidase domain-containing ABC transporter [Microvirga sp. BT291]|nr:peptidase domain-containing ABC transporter [Microvirga pudoricolor]
MILQTEAAECGLACLAMISSYHGHKVDLNTLRRRFPVSLQGVSLRGLVRLASHLHLSCRPIRFEIEHLRQLFLPAILHWDMNHFVVLKKVTSKGIVFHDPATGEQRMSLAEASHHITGVGLELSPSEEFARKDERTRLPFSTFWGHIRGAPHALVQIFVLSIILEILVVAAPLYMQIVIDEVLVKGDVDLLLVLALGFGLLMVISVATNALRSFIILILQNTLHFQMGARLFHHLIRLPLVFFEKRHMGDVLSRFSSIDPIRNQIAEGMVAAVIDGLMAIITLAMIFIYSPQLAVIVVGAVILYAAVRFSLYRWLLSLSEAAIEVKAREMSTFIETMRAVQTVKLFNRESERESFWLNQYAGVVNANVRLGRAQISFKTINMIIFGIENILVVYLAARLALNNVLTVGMIFAFMSYKANFTDKAVMLVEEILEFRILELHLGRIADIALSPLEKGHDRPASYARGIDGRIEVRNVSYRYSETEPFVLDNVNLTVEAGQFVTIMGPSGGGKTTLMKIMLGLLEPTGGEVLIDGVPLSRIGPKAYREHVAAVMQEDQLLSGSLADNISFFDPNFDPQLMAQCASLAGIHDEIMAMPMAYNTLIGDMGSSLSGGQKQRVILARALYRKPRILFLDEGTAHLDTDNERYINESLRSLNITRISVAHRPDIASGTDAILRIGTSAVTAET